MIFKWMMIELVFYCGIFFPSVEIDIDSVRRYIYSLIKEVKSHLIKDWKFCKSGFSYELSPNLRKMIFFYLMTDNYVIYICYPDTRKFQTCLST